MAAFDANLMLWSSTTGVTAGAGVGSAMLVGPWFTLGTGAQGPAAGLSFRTVVATSTGSNTQFLNVIYQLSDDQTKISQTYTQKITGTEAGTGTSGGALVTPLDNSFYARFAPKHNYMRVILNPQGTTAEFSTNVTVGVDAGDFNSQR